MAPNYPNNRQTTRAMGGSREAERDDEAGAVPEVSKLLEQPLSCFRHPHRRKKRRTGMRRKGKVKERNRKEKSM